VSVAQLGPVHVPQTAQPAVQIPPTAAVSIEPPRLLYAGFWRRAAAFAIDTMILSLIFTIFASFYPEKLVIFPQEPDQLGLMLPQFTLAGFLLLFFGMWIYYGVCEASAWQATPGKRVLRLYVVDMLGRPLTFWGASGRYLARRVSDLTFLVGYVVAGFTAKKQALHDLISGCLVLRKK
jgi:uncharacterized RDD family membrane protein YckC